MGSTGALDCILTSISEGIVSQKVAQRDVNLANKLIGLTVNTLDVSRDLTLSGPRLEQVNINDKLEWIEGQMLDLIGFIREYKRKVNPVEVRGQRG